MWVKLGNTRWCSAVSLLRSWLLQELECPPLFRRIARKALLVNGSLEDIDGGVIEDGLAGLCSDARARSLHKSTEDNAENAEQCHTVNALIN